MENIAAIKYVGGGFVVGYNNPDHQDAILMAAFIPLIQMSSPDYYDGGE